ncbi:MAG TPA: hypothetical protein VHW46_01595 [Terracidiphilus sp.]|jgi:hypothetical protein|nr:hypothetical protein [Terracidiphilus sp.]
MLADALLRSVGGTSALLRVPTAGADGNAVELGIVATTLGEIVLSPVVMRKVRPSLRQAEQPQWELMVSATSVAQQAGLPNGISAQALFAMTLAVTVAGQDYLIESVAANEVFGQVYLYRLLLREARPQAL